MHPSTHLKILVATGFLFVGSISPSYAEPEVQPVKPISLKQLAGIEASLFSKTIDQSSSPNKELAVAVGSMDGKEPKWDKISVGEVDGVHSFSFMLDENQCNNYLIDVSANRVVGILDSTHFGTHTQYNHESMAHAWSPDSRWLVETQSWKWDTSVCSVHRIGEKGNIETRLNFLTTAKDVVSKQLLKIAPKLSAEQRAGYAVTVSEEKFSNTGILTASITADVPKSEDSEYVSVSVVVKIVQDKEGKLSADVTKVTKLQ